MTDTRIDTLDDQEVHNMQEHSSRRVKGVIARAQGAPVELVDIILPELGSRDARVRIQACGVCHTDLAYRDGGITQDYPFLLGHEAAGVVEEIGDQVTHVAVGDTVVLNWRAVCGECRACKKGQLEYCFNTHNASALMTLTDGTVLTPALGIGAFIEETVVHEGQCTQVDPEVDPAAAGLLGCGVMAGLGAAVNTGQVQRGESVAVFGLGGVGMAAVAGAALAGASRIIAIDVDDKKLDRARSFGATHCLNPRELEGDDHSNSLGESSAVSGEDLEDSVIVRAIRDLTGGFGVDLAIDAVGIPRTFSQAFYARDLAGRVVLVGVPTPEMTMNIPLLDVFSRGGSLKSSWYGDCLPERDFPLYVDLYKQGRFPLGEFIDRRIAMEDIEQAFEDMKAGGVLRIVVDNESES